MNKLLFIKQSRGGLILPLILLILLLSTCGIAVPYYLNPPVKFANLNFYNAYINDPNFAIGYDFFYRIYDDDILNNTTVVNEANSFFTESILLGLLSNNRSLFSNSYYRRIYPVWDDISTSFENPAIAPIMLIDPIYFDKTDSTKQFEININISNVTPYQGEITSIDYNPAVTYPSEIYFERYVTIDGDEFSIEDFSTLTTVHDDVPDSITDNLGSIAFFVVLYGTTDQFMPIFSEVVYIGSIPNVAISN